MKKATLRGIGIGIGISVLTLGISVTALAANLSITIDDGIKLTINGATFAPKDAKGNPALVFTYEGTTYVPARALSEAMGFTVKYDSTTRTAAVTGAVDATTGATQRVPDSEGYIGEAKAKAAALKHAGISAEAATFVKTTLDSDNGKVIYEVEFYSAGKEYDYDIDATTGAVLAHDNDAEYVAPGQAAYIGEAKAKAIAQAKAPKATIVKCELDMDNGRANYQVDLREGAVEYECDIDAVTGAVLKWEKD